MEFDPNVDRILEKISNMTESGDRVSHISIRPHIIEDGPQGLDERQEEEEQEEEEEEGYIHWQIGWIKRILQDLV